MFERTKNQSRKKIEMNAQVNSRTLDELQSCFSEAEKLSSVSNPTGQQRNRLTFLMSKIAMLKSGISAHELRNWEADRLLAEAGLPRDSAPARVGSLPPEIESEWRDFVQGGEVRESRVPPDREIRANEAGTQSILYTQGTAGGYFVPPAMHNRMLATMAQYDQVFDPEFCNRIETPRGSVLTVPIANDVHNESVLVSETTGSTESDIYNLGNVELNAYTFRSGLVAVSLELLQDSSQFPIGQILEKIFAIRHARGVGKLLVTGSGSSQPTGLLTAALLTGNIVVAGGSATNTGGSETAAKSVGTADLTNLYKALDPAYRMNSVFYMNDATLQYLDGLLDKYGRPIVRVTEGIPTIFNRRIAICPSMPTMTATGNSIVLADPDYFCVRCVPSATFVRRFTESLNLITYGLFGFESFARFDSNLAAPNSNYPPCAVLQQHS